MVLQAQAEASRTEIQAKADAEAKFMAGQGIGHTCLLTYIHIYCTPRVTSLTVVRGVMFVVLQAEAYIHIYIYITHKSASQLDIWPSLMVWQAEAEASRTEIQAKADAEAKFMAGQGIARQRQAIISGLRESVNSFKSEVEGVDAKQVTNVVRKCWFEKSRVDLLGRTGHL